MAVAAVAGASEAPFEAERMVVGVLVEPGEVSSSSSSSLMIARLLNFFPAVLPGPFSFCKRSSAHASFISTSALRVTSSSLLPAFSFCALPVAGFALGLVAVVFFEAVGGLAFPAVDVAVGFLGAVLRRLAGGAGTGASLSGSSTEYGVEVAAGRCTGKLSSSG